MAWKFILATNNPGKLEEMRAILSRLGVEVLSPEEAGVSVEVEETGTTFEENAMLKAKAFCEASGLPAIGDDSGLCVNALNGGPGVYSARFGGEGLDDAARRLLLLNMIRGQTDRSASFFCSIAAAFPGGDTLTARGRCDGMIAFAPLGQGGFGYDPIFLYRPLSKTFGQMTDREKNAVSHRGKALEAFAEVLKAYLEEKGAEMARREAEAAQKAQAAQEAAKEMESGKREAVKRKSVGKPPKRRRKNWKRRCMKKARRQGSAETKRA